MPDQNSFCEEHQCFFELYEANDFHTGDYYECPECERERSGALYDGPHYENWGKKHSPIFKPKDRVWFGQFLGEVVGASSVNDQGEFTQLVDFFPQRFEGSNFKLIPESELRKAQEGEY